MKTNRQTTTEYVRYDGWKPESHRCVVFDMDDTLCVYEEGKLYSDCRSFKPKNEFVTMARAARNHGYDVVIATARPHACSFDTWQWLNQHGVKASAVYLRNSALKEYKAEHVKSKMFEDILDHWEVEAFYDDSPYTVEAIKSLGVNAVYVPGNEDYWATARG